MQDLAPSNWRTRAALMISSGLLVFLLVFGLGYLGLSKYRLQRFYRVCLTGDDELVKGSGYLPCPFSPRQETETYCDPRQLPSPSAEEDYDRCEMKREGRRLLVSFLPRK